MPETSGAWRRRRQVHNAAQCPELHELDSQERPEAPLTRVRSLSCAELQMLKHLCCCKAAGNSRRTNVRILMLLVIFSLFQNVYLAESFYWYEKVSGLHSVYGSFFFKNTLIKYLKIIFWSYSLFLPWLPQISAPTVSTQLCPFILSPGMWLAYEGLCP